MRWVYCAKNPVENKVCSGVKAKVKAVKPIQQTTITKPAGNPAVASPEQLR